MSRIVLHVDRLVLRGIDRADTAAFSAALQAELQARLGGEPGLPALAAHNDESLVRVSQARVPKAANATLLGRTVAASIVGGGRSRE